MPTTPSKHLDFFDNPNPEQDYTIQIRIPEFTCLCPKTGQPDFATLHLEYVPDRKCLELKSLKLYVWSYRNEGAFHEAVTHAILNDLVRATAPRYMQLRAEFNVRGGIYTTVTAEYRQSGWTPRQPLPRSRPEAGAAEGAGTVILDTSRIAVSAAAAPVKTAESPAAPSAQGARRDNGRFRMLPRPRRPEPSAAPPEKSSGARAKTKTPAAPADQAPAEAGPATPARAPVYLGIDFGTSSCQVVAIDRQGAILAQAAAPIPLPVRRGNEISQDPALWWQALSACLEALFTEIEPARVRRLAVDGTSGTVLLCDPQGNPLDHALMYHDARAAAQAERIQPQPAHPCGAHGASSALAKLLWLQDRKLPRQAAHLLHQADWIAGRLTGLWGHSDYNNCLKLGYDAERLAWPDWFSALGVETRLLPVVHRPGEELGNVSPEIARGFGLAPDAVLVAGTTDGVAAFLAAGIEKPGDAVTSLGSTLVIKLLSDKPVFAPEHGVYSHRLGRYWLAGGASNSGGAVLLQYFKIEQMREMTPLLDPESLTGLEYYPLPDVGERFPINDPHKLPVLEPLPGDSVTFFQGLLEGIARIEAQGYKLLRNLGAPRLTEVRTTGGGAENPAWQRLRERILGVPVRKARSGLAAYGTALLAAGLAEKTLHQSPATEQAETA